MRIAIIIPVLNEAEQIVACLTALQDYRQQGHQLIIADGGSEDETLALAEPLADLLCKAPRGRARQMNTAAAKADADVLLFLHADTRLPLRACEHICAAVEAGSAWGRFDVRLSGRHFLLRIIERMMNWRSRVSSIATGDQAIFVARQAFDAVGGYADIPLMEDVAISRSLKRRFACAKLRQRVVTSSRRWEQGGILATVLLMWRLRLAYWLGTDPAVLAKRYYP